MHAGLHATGRGRWMALFVPVLWLLFAAGQCINNTGIAALFTQHTQTYTSLHPQVLGQATQWRVCQRRAPECERDE